MCCSPCSGYREDSGTVWVTAPVMTKGNCSLVEIFASWHKSGCWGAATGAMMATGGIGVCSKMWCKWELAVIIAYGLNGNHGQEEACVTVGCHTSSDYLHVSARWSGVRSRLQSIIFIANCHIPLQWFVIYVTSYCLYSAHKLCQITWHSGLLAQLEQHIIVGICCLSHKQIFSNKYKLRKLFY